MDENEDEMSLDFTASCRFRQQILEYTRYWLGLAPVYPQMNVVAKLLSWLLPSPKDENGWAYTSLAYLGVESEQEPPCMNAACSVFKDFGQMVQRAHTKGLLNPESKVEFSAFRSRTVPKPSAKCSTESWSSISTTAKLNRRNAYQGQFRAASKATWQSGLAHLQSAFTAL